MLIFVDYSTELSKRAKPSPQCARPLPTNKYNSPSYTQPKCHLCANLEASSRFSTQPRLKHSYNRWRKNLRPRRPPSSNARPDIGNALTGDDSKPLADTITKKEKFNLSGNTANIHPRVGEAPSYSLGATMF